MLRRLIFAILVGAFGLALVAPPPSLSVVAHPTPTPPHIEVLRVMATPIPTPKPVPNPDVFIVLPTEGVALTFDDGPNPQTTPHIMDILESHGVRGTFFLVGREAAKYPDLVREIVGRGHIIANHTWGHRNLMTLTEDGWHNEVDRTTQLLEELSGRRIHCVRPPYGRIDERSNAKIHERGLDMLKWNVDTRDWTKPGADTIFRRATANLHPGQIILMHDGGGNREQTVQALGRIIEKILGSHLKVQPIC